MSHAAGTANLALHTEPVPKRVTALRSCCKCTPADVCGVFSNAVCLAQSHNAILSTGGFVHMSHAAATANLALHTEPVPKRVTAVGSCCKYTPADVCGVSSNAVCLTQSHCAILSTGGFKLMAQWL